MRREGGVRKTKSISKVCKLLADKYTFLNEMFFPDQSPLSAQKSLFKQSQNFLDKEVILNMTKVLEVVEKVAENYPHTNPKRSKFDRAYIERTFEFKIRKQGSPGLPWQSMGYTTNQQVWDQDKELLIEKTLNLYHNLSSSEPPSNPVNLIFDWVAPLHVFVKNEGHNITKIHTPRLIDGTPLHEQFIDRFLFEEQNETEIDNWVTCPSKPGFGLSTKMQEETFIKTIPKTKLASADAKGWDWLVKVMGYIMDYMGRCRLEGIPYIEDSNFVSFYYRLQFALFDMYGYDYMRDILQYCIAKRNRIYCISRASFCTSDGLIWVAVCPGKIKSGWYCTSSSNSRIRVMYGYYLDVDWIIAMGDDDLETIIDDAVRKYEEIGIKLKFYEYFEPGEIEFCGRRFDSSGIHFVNKKKSIFHFVNKPFDEDILNGLVFELRYDREYLAEFLQDYKWALEFAH